MSETRYQRVAREQAERQAARAARRKAELKAQHRSYRAFDRRLRRWYEPGEDQTIGDYEIYGADR